MRQYFKVTLLLGLMWITNGQVQHVTDLKIEGHEARIRDLEIAVKQLVEIQSSKSANPSTNKVLSSGVPQAPLPFNVLQGFTLEQSGDEKGFYVILVDDVTVTHDKKIKFDKVEENFGRAYDTVNSEFICPISGTYLLSLNIACQTGSYVEAAVEVSNERGYKRYVLNSVCDHRKRSLNGGKSLYCGYTQNGGTIITSLKKGEKVSVKKVWPHLGSSTIVGQGFSSFSGYLLRPS